MKKNFSRNYKLLLVFFISTAAILLYTGCKKYATPAAGTGSLLSEDARSWYENDVIQNEIKNSKDTLPLKKGLVRKPGLMKQIGGLLKWNDAMEYNDKGTSFLVTPLDEDIKPFANKDYEAGRCLIFYKDAAGDMQMRIMEMIGQKGMPINGTIQEIASAAFHNYTTGKNISQGRINTNILFYNRDYKYEKGFAIRTGAAGRELRLQNSKQAAKRPPLSTMNKRESEADGCTIHYLVGYHYDTGTGQIVDYEILTTWAECPDGETYPSYGGGGGDGGVAPLPPTDECVIGAAHVLDEMTTNVTVVNNTVSISLEAEYALTRTKKYDWVVLQSVGWSIHSFETGVHVKNSNPDPSLSWQWQSLKNNGIGMSGVSIGGNIDYSVIRAIPSVGKYNAIMDLDFKVKYSIACKGSPFSSSVNYNSAKNFNVND